jgi:branched-chain amino acid transport system permease protein
MSDLSNKLRGVFESSNNPLARNVSVLSFEASSRQLIVVGILATLCLAALPYTLLGSYYTGLFTTIFIFIGLAGGFNIIAGFTGQLSLGHAVFFGAGGYVTVLVWKAGYTLWFSLFAATLVSIVFAVIVGVITLRLSGLYFAFGTLAVSEATRLYITQWQAVNASAGLAVTTPPPLSSTGFYILGLSLVVILTVTTYLLKHSIFGMRLQAIRDDEIKAKAQGINVWLYMNISFVLSAIFPAIAGGIYAMHLRRIGPSVFAANININMQLMAVLGGLGTVLGPPLGGALFYSVFQYAGVNFPQFQLLITGVLLIIVILYIPEGLINTVFTEVWPDNQQTEIEGTKQDTPTGSDQQ